MEKKNVSMWNEWRKPPEKQNTKHNEVETMRTAMQECGVIRLIPDVIEASDKHWWWAYTPTTTRNKSKIKVLILRAAPHDEWIKKQTMSSTTLPTTNHKQNEINANYHRES